MAKVKAIDENEVLDTVVVEGKDGPVTINKSDFDPKKHKEVKGKAAAEPKSEGKSPEEMTVKELHEALDAAEISYPAKASKEDLIDLLTKGG